MIETLKMKTPLGKFPVLQLSDGQTCISESLSIAKFFANNKHGFYGPDETERVQIDQWVDIISTQIHPLAKNTIDQVLGLRESEIRSFSQQSGQLRSSLEVFDKHLKLRNFLVGYKMTLADVYLTAVLIAPFQLMLDDKMRKQQLPNLTRYMSLNLQIQHFKLAFGRITFCSKILNPNFDLKIEKPKQEKQPEKKDAKKEAAPK